MEDNSLEKTFLTTGGARLTVELISATQPSTLDNTSIKHLTINKFKTKFSISIV